MALAEPVHVFVGGTGRSGTSILAKLLGSHPWLTRIPIEVRFLADRRGLCDLVEGRSSLAQFQDEILGRWWHRTTALGETRGLHKIVPRERLEEALEVLRTDFSSDPWAAGRRFVHSLLDPIAEESSARSWVEDTPPNIMVAPTLLRVVPTARLIHMIRDGRDVACSVVELSWGPSELTDALEWWAQTLLTAHRRTAAIDERRLLTLRFEDLVRDRREQSLDRILGFLDLPDDPEFRAFFTRVVDADRAHVGRWRDDVPVEHQGSFLAMYDRVLDDLRVAGVPVVAPHV